MISCFLYAPQLGIKPATSVCALTENRTCNLLMNRTMLQPTEPLGQDDKGFNMLVRPSLVTNDSEKFNQERTMFFYSILKYINPQMSPLYFSELFKEMAMIGMALNVGRSSPLRGKLKLGEGSNGKEQT